MPCELVLLFLDPDAATYMDVQLSEGLRRKKSMFVVDARVETKTPERRGGNNDYAL